MKFNIAIVHDWLASSGGAGGAEKTLEAVLEIFPDAPVYTTVYNPERMPQKFREYNIRTSFLQNFPFARANYQLYLPIMPLAIENINLDEFDVVISFSHSFAKGVITRPSTLHISYSYTPFRYVWDMYHTYLNYEATWKKIFIPFIFNYLRIWDVTTSSRVDKFIAISRYTSSRIKKYYGREAEVIYPPVEVDKFYISRDKDEYFLIVSRLVPYKRIDLAIKAFNRLGLQLIIIGTGTLLNDLKKIAGPNIKFMGRQDENVVREYLSRCRAFVFPGEEDFGIAPVEAMASGTPIIAYRKGGILETLDEESGVFFSEQSPDSLAGAVENFCRREFSPEKIREKASRFDKKIFQEKFLHMVIQNYKEWSGK